MTTKITFAGNATLPSAATRPDRREARQVLRFAVTGCACVAVDFAVYQWLSGLLSPHVAKGISYLAGVGVGFVGNKVWTFESRQKSWAEPALYLLVYAITLAINVAVNAFVRAETGSETFAFLTATGITTVLNYLGLRFLAFRAAARRIA